MNKYIPERTDDFFKDMKKIKKNFELQKQLLNKISEILIDPHHYKNLRNVMKGKQRVHIDSYVLIFEIKEVEQTVVFHNFKHHNDAYQ